MLLKYEFYSRDSISIDIHLILKCIKKVTQKECYFRDDQKSLNQTNWNLEAVAGFVRI